jgi:hypothetical protein
MAEREEELTLDRLCSGDRPSVYIAGMAVAHALKKGKVAVLSVDVLGRVVVLPQEAVELKALPKLKDEDLDKFEEDQAITLMLKEGREEDEILSYLKRREDRNGDRVL